MNKQMVAETIALMNNSSPEMFDITNYGYAGGACCNIGWLARSLGCILGEQSVAEQLDCSITTLTAMAYPKPQGMMNYIKDKLYPDERKRLMICSMQIFHDTETVDWKRAFEGAGLRYPDLEEVNALVM